MFNASRGYRFASRTVHAIVTGALSWASAGETVNESIDGAGAAAVALVVAGGVLYSLGAVVYGMKRPNPSPSWFGFHEVFHTLTVAAYLAHYVAVWLVVHG